MSSNVFPDNIKRDGTRALLLYAYFFVGRKKLNFEVPLAVEAELSNRSLTGNRKRCLLLPLENNVNPSDRSEDLCRPLCG